MLRVTIYLLLSFVLFSPAVMADGQAPWGRAKVTPTQYPPMKVVYDVTTGDQSELEHVLDRVSYLSTLTGADPFEQSIVLVLHGSSIKFFAIKNFDEYENLQRRAQSLTVGGVIQIRMCKLAAEGQGFKPEDIHGFLEMVPMGDAEIVRLQFGEGHAYMQ